MNGQRVPGRSAGRHRAPVTATTGQVPPTATGQILVALDNRSLADDADLLNQID
jgi:hypothetical protein